MTGITSPDLKRNNAAGGYVAGSPAAPSPLDAIDYGNDAGLAERRLWVSVLALMVDDARRYWQGRKSHSGRADELEEAFDCLIQCTWMLRRICTYTGHDAEALSKGFNVWCESVA